MWIGEAVIPDDWSSGYKVFCVQWPDSADYEAILRGLLQMPLMADFWEKQTGDVTDPIAAIEETLQINMHLEECSMIPIGLITPFGGDVVPDGWFLCDGSEVSRTTYSGLFNQLGVFWGDGDGSTTFNLPDGRGKAFVGQSTTVTGTQNIGDVGGEEKHTLTVLELAVHTHAQNAHNHTQNPHNHGFSSSVLTAGAGGGTPGGGSNNPGINQTNDATAVNLAQTATNINAGGGQGHSSMQPFFVGQWIIKAL